MYTVFRVVLVRPAILLGEFSCLTTKFSMLNGTEHGKKEKK